MFAGKRIRTPWKHRWRRFRYSILPMLSFVVCVALTIWMWGRQLEGTSIVGEVERRRFDVTSAADGRLAEPDADDQRCTLFAKVAANDVVARLDSTPVTAALATARLEIDRLKKDVDAAEADFALTRDDRRADQQYDYGREHLRLIAEVERCKLDILDRDTQIETDRADQQRLDIRIQYLTRASGLGGQGVVSPQTLDEARKERDTVARRIEMNTRALAEAREQQQTAAVRLREFALAESPEVSNTLSRILAPLQAAIATQQALVEELKIQIDALVIRAPISGTIAAIYRWPGQNVRAGDPILTVAADLGEYIIAYVRQDQPFRPTVGMQVVVRTRVPGRPPLTAEVTEVGPQFELAPVELLRDPTRPEWVLPVRISFPPLLDARPGEPLDLFFRGDPSNQPG